MKKRISIAVICIFLITGLYVVFVEPFTIRVKTYEISTPKWTYDKTLKIALIADVHATWPWMTDRHIQRIIKKTNEQEPDLILLLGDYVATHPFGIQPDANESYQNYEALVSKCGVFSVLGNHDWHGSVGWPEAVRNSKIPVLENNAIEIDCNSKKIWVAGLEDLWWQDADVKSTMNKTTKNYPVIMMMHNPDSFPEIPKHVALSVAGHTHAGQIRFPIVGSVEAVIPSRFGKRYEHGHIVEGGKDLIVSAGLGTTGLPMRFLNPPEIVIIQLKAEKVEQ